MPEAPIPQRIPPLAWRKPALLWTPLALGLAIGWPALAFFDHPGMQRLALLAGCAVFALALAGLGAAWALGRAPKARRTIVVYIVAAGAIASLCAPLALAALLSPPDAPPSLANAAAMLPPALMLGLPMSFVSGFAFAWIALVKRASALDDYGLRPDVQPFR